MKKYFFTFLFGLLIGSSGYWLCRDGPLAEKLRKSSAVTKTTEAIEKRATERAANEVKEEMEKSGQVVMNKAAAVTPIDDKLLDRLVEAKLAADPLTAKAEIESNVDAGKVALDGSASSYDQVSRAIRLALECEATSSVVSKVKVK
jgi:osmotically-inducible protein OsmY